MGARMQRRTHSTKRIFADETRPVRPHPDGLAGFPEGPGWAHARGPNGSIDLTMLTTDGYLSAAIASPLGVTPGYNYDAALSFEFVVDTSKAGNQLISGSIQFLGQPTPAGDPSSVPEPASALMVVFGMI